MSVTEKGVLKQIIFTAAVAIGLGTLLGASQAHATPIQPDIRKIVSQPQPDSTAEFMPARAGWQGPEMTPSEKGPDDALLQGRAAARASRQALVAAATPDPRTVLGILALILLLRALRGRPKPIAAPQTAEETQLAA